MTTTNNTIPVVHSGKGEVRMKKLSLKHAGVAALALSFLGATAIFAQAAEVKDATVAFLMPDQASTRYEQHDYPGFAAEMKKLCESCKVIYQNADADAAPRWSRRNSRCAQRSGRAWLLSRGRPLRRRARDPCS